MVVKISKALISVFDKTDLNSIVLGLHALSVEIYSTGGTQEYIEGLGVPVIPVERITGYPSILDGRVKTLHPSVFGGILSRNIDSHQKELDEYKIPVFDLVIVDLYPFEATVKEGKSHEEIIEKIDIGGIALIRAAAKNFDRTVIIPSKNSYSRLLEIINSQNGSTNLIERKLFAKEAFNVTSHYDNAIHTYFLEDDALPSVFKKSIQTSKMLRYGENPHQKAKFFGNLDEVFEIISGKDISYNNLVDMDAAINLMKEFESDKPTIVIIKHTNACGVATRDTVSQAWDDALACDSTSAFGGIISTNAIIDFETAQKIDKIFYEVLIAPGFTHEALDLLKKKGQRVLVKLLKYPNDTVQYKSLLSGVIVQDTDAVTLPKDAFEVKTKLSPSEDNMRDLVFALKCVKHLKSNTIVLVKDQQMIGMGCGQTSRIDATHQAIKKAKEFGFDLENSVMASDAFFPFPDCVEVAFHAGIKSVIQPGGSIKDQLSIDFCDENCMSMVFTGIRHFRH